MNPEIVNQANSGYQLWQLILGSGLMSTVVVFLLNAWSKRGENSRLDRNDQLKDYKEDIQRLETKIGSLEEKMETLIQANSLLFQENVTLKAENTSMKARITFLEKELEARTKI